jgi:hypothetical protein
MKQLTIQPLAKDGEIIPPGVIMVTDIGTLPDGSTYCVCADNKGFVIGIDPVSETSGD